MTDWRTFRAGYRPRSEGNVFTSVCQSFCPLGHTYLGRGWCIPACTWIGVCVNSGVWTEGGMCGRGGGTPPEMATGVVGMHPTGKVTKLRSGKFYWGEKYIIQGSIPVGCAPSICRAYPIVLPVGRSRVYTLPSPRRHIGLIMFYSLCRNIVMLHKKMSWQPGTFCTKTIRRWNFERCWAALVYVHSPLPCLHTRLIEKSWQSSYRAWLL